MSCEYWDEEIKTCRRSEVPKFENGWIPVTERLPEKGEKVMACDIDGDIMLGWMHDRTHLCAVDDYYKNITAWMPLPEPWKGDEE